MLRSISCFGSLVALRLDFKQTSLADIAQLGMSLGQLGALQSLLIDFTYCADIASVPGLGEALLQLKDLRSLSLDFACSGIRSVPDLGAGLAALKSLEELRVSFQFCGLSPLCGLEIASGIVAEGSLPLIQDNEEYSGQDVGQCFNLCFNGCVGLPAWLAKEDEGGFWHPQALVEVSICDSDR